MIDGLAAFLSAEWGADDVGFEDHAFGAPGTNHRLTLLEAAALARAKGRVDLLDVAQTTEIAGRSYPNGVHITEVEIDPETGALTMDRYTVVDDFGTLVAPMLVMGQIHGGVAQGFGQAVTENAVFDAQGQLLTGSFMDYGMPRADDLPMIRFASEPVPTARNPLGMKGCGEAGTVGALAAVSNAVRDALAERGVGHVDMPFTPSRIWGWLNPA
jgi:aerobic carbon-monoxide dehydrogenase large subunit